jgi:hypothetical protein
MKKIFSLFIIFAFSQLTNGQSKEETAVANAVEKLRMARSDREWLHKPRLYDLKIRDSVEKIFRRGAVKERMVHVLQNPA